MEMSKSFNLILTEVILVYMVIKTLNLNKHIQPVCIMLECSTLLFASVLNNLKEACIPPDHD